MARKDLIRSVVVVTVIFTILDWLLHLFNILPPLDALPSYYFIFKLIALPIILLFLMRQFKWQPDKFPQAFFLCISAAVILQARYFLINAFTLQTDLLMMALHYFMILGAFFIIRSKAFRSVV